MLFHVWWLQFLSPKRNDYIEFPPFISGGLGQFEKTEKCDDHWFSGTLVLELISITKKKEEFLQLVNCCYTQMFSS